MKRVTRYLAACLLFLGVALLGYYFFSAPYQLPYGAEGYPFVDVAADFDRMNFDVQPLELHAKVKALLNQNENNWGHAYRLVSFEYKELST